MPDGLNLPEGYKYYLVDTSNNIYPVNSATTFCREVLGLSGEALKLAATGIGCVLRGDNWSCKGYRLYKGSKTAKLAKRGGTYNFTYNEENYIEITSLINFCRQHPELKKDPEQSARGLSKLHNGKIKSYKGFTNFSS